MHGKFHALAVTDLPACLQFKQPFGEFAKRTVAREHQGLTAVEQNAARQLAAEAANFVAGQLKGKLGIV